MNYITRLQEENADLKDQLSKALEEVNNFRVHLASPKFQGTDLDGSRKDWISTNDVRSYLLNISDTIQGV